MAAPARFGGWLVFLLAFQAVAVAAPVPGQGTWETTLLPRDVNGDGITDAYFDATLKITWLKDAQQTSGSWDGVQAYLQAFQSSPAAGPLGGWRLPVTTLAGTGGCTSISVQWTDCPLTSEMAHLYYTTLGNTGYPTGGLTNTGPFSNLFSDTLSRSYYWSGTADGSNSPNNAWAFYFRQGVQVTLDKRMGISAMFVRDGDVLAQPVPEPSTFGLALAALLGLAAAKRQRTGS